MPRRCRRSRVKGSAGVIVSAQPSAEKQFTRHAACSPWKFLKFFRFELFAVSQVVWRRDFIKSQLPTSWGSWAGRRRCPRGGGEDGVWQGLCSGNCGWGAGGAALGPVADGWEEGRSPRTSLLQSPKTWRWGEGHGCAPGWMRLCKTSCTPTRATPFTNEEAKAHGGGQIGRDGVAQAFRCAGGLTLLTGALLLPPSKLTLPRKQLLQESAPHPLWREQTSAPTTKTRSRL